MTAVGIDPLAAHLFVFYFATISVITPPVCVAVFVGSGIAGTNWLPAAGEAVRLGAVTYIVPFLLLLYPGMLLGGGPLDILEAVAAGLVLVIAVPGLLAGARLHDVRAVDIALYLVIIALAIYPHPVTPFIALALLGGAYYAGRAGKRRATA
ncbi:TRAP transporter large permease subunit [uncultured Paracoccus sp.]|mgnify:CR=1 FL=1|uniref:TRAP transporter large permease subunit n=1 Tax=uncultured Paracoccus sp. TaxID=189685 RepID=UPI00263088EC|nr:TRAP transporter large permease subunit [uncultured Paracoccus sp.]HMR36796.1 TRAP transporter large permease subunit [Paracoccus sp. (in: a-proteobacteria)]